jgi:hypothetical protein
MHIYTAEHGSKISGEICLKIYTFTFLSFEKMAVYNESPYLTPWRITEDHKACN